MKVAIRSHGFFCYPETATERRSLETFCGTITQMDTVFDNRTKTNVTIPKAVFATCNTGKTEYGFLISELERFKEHLKHTDVRAQDVTYAEYKVAKGDHVSFKMDTPFSPRGEQPEAIEFAIAPNEKTRCLEAATGFGKTFLGFHCVNHFKTRTACVMSPGHITTWVKCANEYMGLGPQEVLVIQGSGALKAIMRMAEGGVLEAKMLFFSSATMRNYFKAYETEEVFDYPFKPHELWEKLGIGFMVMDEVHESIHNLVRQVIFSHVPRIMYLSATLVSDDEFINGIYEKVYSKVNRWKSKDNRHICVRSVLHHMRRDLKGFRFKGPRGYQHVLYEQSIMKKQKLLKQYLAFIDQLFRSSFINGHKKGLKALLLFSTKAMCHEVHDYLKTKYPYLSFGCYVDGAPKEELYERDVVLSTPGSAGTGKDIPGLYVCILGIALGSTQLSRQIMGRLRPVKIAPELDPLFLYLTCKDIPQHMAYHRKKMEDLRLRSKDLKEIKTNFVLGGFQ